jgi:hypothetical protein
VVQKAVGVFLLSVFVALCSVPAVFAVVRKGKMRNPISFRLKAGSTSKVRQNGIGVLLSVLALLSLTLTLTVADAAWNGANQTLPFDSDGVGIIDEGSWSDDGPGMILPFNRREISSDGSRTIDHKTEGEDEGEEDLGDGLSFLSSEIDPFCTVLKVKIDSNQLAKLTGRNTYRAELDALTAKIYSKFRDDFDFLFFILGKDSDRNIMGRLGFAGVCKTQSNTVSGIGRNVSGGGKLKSTLYVPSYDSLVLGPALHELAHTWAAYICSTYDEDNKPYPAHWGISNAGGQLGGFRYVRTVEKDSGGVTGKTKYQASFRSDERNPDGSFKDGGFGMNANGGNSLPYSDIELYLMGMKSAQELRNTNFTLDIYSGNSVDSEGMANGYFYSTQVTRYTIDDIIALHGPRVPDAGTSQKNFKLLTVLLSDETDTDKYATIVKSVEWFTGPTDDNTFSDFGVYNFAQATSGIGSLAAEGLKNSLRTGDEPSGVSDESSGVSGVGCNVGFGIAAIVIFLLALPVLLRRHSI